MKSLWLRTRVGFLALLLGFALSAAPAGAYCNLNPCSQNRHLVCTVCSYVDLIGGSFCRVTVIYCVDCHSGEILSWDESIDYCSGGPV